MNSLHHATPMKEKHYLAELRELLSVRGQQESMAEFEPAVIHPSEEASSKSVPPRQQVFDDSSAGRGDCRPLDPESRAKAASFAIGAAHQHTRTSWRFTGPHGRENREWYNVMVHAPCHRQESFASKSKAWFGGQGSVRGLVRRYESTSHLPTNGTTGMAEPFAVLDRNRLNYASIREKTQKPSCKMPLAGSHPSAPCLTQTDTSNEPTNSGSSAGNSGNRSTSNSLDSARQLQVKSSSQGKASPVVSVLDKGEPPLPPFPDEADQVVPSAPPLSAPVVENERFPTPPPPDWFGESQKVPAPVRPKSMPVRETKVESSSRMEIGIQKDSVRREGSPDHITRTKRKPLREMREEVYYSAVGEGGSTTARSRVGSSRDDSDRSRMGDLHATGTALEQMAHRLKKRESLNTGKARTKAITTAARRPTITTTGFPKSFNRYGEPLSRTVVTKPRRHSIPSKSEEGIVEDDLDLILQNRNNRKVSYFRCPEPDPMLEPRNVASDEFQPVTSTPDSEAVRKGASKSRSRTRDRSAYQVDMLETRKALCFDSGNTSSSGSSDGLPRKRRHISERNFGGEETVYENRNGEIVFRTDAQRGYEFSSTISMRTSDWNQYTITRTRRELRTGRVARQQDHVRGKRVVQHVVWDETAATGRYQQQPFDDTLYTVSYDGNSDDPEESDSGFEPSRRYPPPPENFGAYKEDRRTYITNAPIAPPAPRRDSLFCCFPVCR